MAGKYNGASAIIAVKYPCAIYNHCANHILNLCITKATSVNAIRNCFDTIKEVVTYFHLSPKRTYALKTVIEEDAKITGPKKRHLKV